MTIVPFLSRVNAVILNPLITLVFTVSFIYFAYGVVRFLSMDADAKGTSREEAKGAIFWGLVGMFIMFSVFGILRFVLSTFQVQSNPGTQYILK
jgi:hypothetical protein